MVDKKINSKELAQNGVIVNGVEIIPAKAYDENSLNNLRFKRKIPYYRIGHLCYYQVSELVEWIKSKKVAVA